MRATGGYARALRRAERGHYRVPGATVPWLLLPLAGPAVSVAQGWRVSRAKRRKRKLVDEAFVTRDPQDLPTLGFGDAILLRSFGNDGGVTIGHAANGDEPVETLIASVLQQLGYRGVYALGYRATNKLPRGPTYCEVGDEKWREQLGEALRACSAIIVHLHDSTEFRPGFAHELREIGRSRDLTAKTVLVGSHRPTQGAYDTVSETLHHLGWHTPRSIPVACAVTNDGRLAVYPAPERAEHARTEYSRALAACLVHTPDFPQIFRSSTPDHDVT